MPSLPIYHDGGIYTADTDGRTGTGPPENQEILGTNGILTNDRRRRSGHHWRRAGPNDRSIAASTELTTLLSLRRAEFYQSSVNWILLSCESIASHFLAERRFDEFPFLVHWWRRISATSRPPATGSTFDSRIVPEGFKENLNFQRDISLKICDIHDAINIE